MKIQIDTKEKTLAVEQDVNIDEFFKAIKKLFPNGEWKEYILKTETVINWSSPIYVEKWSPYPYIPDNPPYYPWVTCDESNSTSYCVEIN